MRRRLTAAALILSGLAALYLLAGYASARIAWVETRAAGDGRLETIPEHSGVQLAAALAVHTSRSHDALGSEDDVATAAREAGIDVVFITDHRSPETADSLWRTPAEYRGDILLVRGQELSLGPDVGRLLVFGLDTTVYRWEGSLEALARRLARDSALAIVAHARSPRIRDSWRPDRAPGIAGWEVLDLADIGRERLKGPWVAYHLTALAAGAAIGRLHHSLVRLHREGFAVPAVAAFDSISARRRITAVAGLDAHPKGRLFGRLLPGYEPFFRAAANHIVVSGPLSGDAAEAAEAVMRGLAGGHVHVSLFGPEAGAGFSFVALEPTGGVAAWMGGIAALEPETRLAAGLAAGGSGRLLYRVVRDGSTHLWSRGPSLAIAVHAPGVYRVEVYRYSLRIGSLFWNLRPWLFSNPITIAPRGEEGGSPAPSP